MIWPVLYMACCALGVAACVVLTRLRHQDAKTCIWWGWSVVAFGLLWEAWDCAWWGAPDFPSSRWLLLPGLAVTLSAAAVRDLIAAGLRTPFAGLATTRAASARTAARTAALKQARGR